MAIHQSRIKPQKLCCHINQLSLGQITMSLSGRLLQTIYNSCLNPEIRILIKSCLSCNLISNLKTNSGNVLCQFIRVGAKHLIHLLTILAVNLYGKIHTDPIILQKDHCLTHLPLLVKLIGRLNCQLYADSLDLSQPFRFLLKDPKGIFFKFPDNACRQSRSDSLNRTGSQIFFNCHGIFRLFFLIRNHLDLFSIFFVKNSLTPHHQILSLRHIGKASHTAYLIIPFRMRQMQHSISIFFISKHDVFHVSF